MRWYRGAYLELIFCVFRSFLWLLEQGLDHTRHPPLVSLPHFDTTRTQDASCDVFANRPPRFALHRLNICSAPPTLAPADYRNKATRNLQNLKPNSRLCSCRSYAFRVRCSVSGDWALGLSAFDSSCSSSWVPGRFDKRYFCPRQWLAGTVTLALANIPCTALRHKRKRGPGITLLSIGPAATGKGHKVAEKGHSRRRGGTRRPHLSQQNLSADVTVRVRVRQPPGYQDKGCHGLGGSRVARRRAESPPSRRLGMVVPPFAFCTGWARDAAQAVTVPGQSYWLR